ncbi:hypothetical protein ALC62_14858 [Cyphomyrmex costatus]|uniref:Uncharacterized protein n=1 Tax=Cyphomyrmex costatus TaxID=456900 RepID=A0A195C1C1_9HYME|nr:hypothetical protein ALC62_14858 [Cyphomyrmex costatus]
METVPRSYVPWHVPLCIFGRKGGKDKKRGWNGRTVGRATRILVNVLSAGS